MSNKYKFRDQETLYFVTFTTVNWVDVLTRPEYKDLIIKSISYCQKHKGLLVHAYVIMSNHVHLIVSRNGVQLLEHIFRDMKKFTANAILDAVENNSQESRKTWLLSMFGFEGRKHPDSRNNKVWQAGNHPIEINDGESLQNYLDYVHNNPVKAGLVFEPWQYVYSSAADYMNKHKGLLEIDFV